MKRTIYVAGVNTRKLAASVAHCPYWLLSVTLVRAKKTMFREWLFPYLDEPMADGSLRHVIWDPGTFSDDAVSYQTYRRIVDYIRERWPHHEYLQYDEIGDPEATAFYLEDMRRRGYDPIPVLTVGGDKSLLREPRVMVGGVARMGPKVRRAYLDHLFDGFTPAPDQYVHLLGMSQKPWFHEYQATGGDSTTWIPRAPYNRRLTIDEWVARDYGEQDIPYIGRTAAQPIEFEEESAA